ncbi:hypothetical protein VP1G_00173 [Cytospora mali]|uniref:Replication factor A protein 3 n=1 Tax=Cytospora mali TaxID=578113 RepID=A0A194ULT7_CYTMA|nr:hypothetical protein VP1G_00173 [Valsa mali var. pyri (nom. inval.)]
MESLPTPRITAPYLDSYRGRNVMIIGRVVQLRGDQATVEADGNITAHLNRSSISLGWPSDSVVSQSSVVSSQTHDDEEHQDEFSGDSLAEDMTRLDIDAKGKGPLAAVAASSSSSSSSMTTTMSSSPSPPVSSEEPPSTRLEQQQCRRLPELDEMLLNQGDRSYKSLGSEFRAPARVFEANAALWSHKNSTMSSEVRCKTQWHLGRFGNVDDSPELVNSIFGDISTEVRGKRLALLSMDESGRWRVACSQRPAKTFPDNDG